MIVKFLSVASVVLLAGCSHNAQLRTVVADLESTPGCDTQNVWLHPKDTKKEMMGKIIILNSKLDCHDDSDFYVQQKLDNYKNLKSQY